MDKYEEIKKIFASMEDGENALSMAKYMRNMFDFYGIPSPARRKSYSGFLASEKRSKTIDWGFLDSCWEDGHREFQYLVSDYLLAMKRYVTFEDIPMIERYIVSRSWWDTVDFLCKVIGDIGLRDPRAGELMKEWAVSDNIWKRRTAI